MMRMVLEINKIKNFEILKYFGLVLHTTRVGILRKAVQSHSKDIVVLI